MKHLFSFGLLITCFFSSITTKAQSTPALSSAEILLGLKKLNVLGSVLYIGAHPDDENTRLMAYLSKERLLRTGYLSLTRGDGGQNLIGNEQGINLGLIRTQELLAARRIDGAEQFFSTAFDFGFSKTSDETFRIWNKEKILADVVWVIRKFQPDVIITRFPEDARAGHGHHAASAILAREAFYAAADPNRFPEQFAKGVKVWQAKRVVWNTFNFGNTNTTSENQLKIDVGAFNALLGKSYGEIAADSRSQHKSQGFGVPKSRGLSIEYFTNIAGDAPVIDIMDAVDLSWTRTGNEKVSDDIQKIIQQFDMQQPDKSIARLEALNNHLSFNINNSYWVIRKLDEVTEMIKACLGLFVEAVANKQLAVEGDSLRVSFNVINRSKVPVKKVKILYGDTSFVLSDSLPYNQVRSVQLTRLVTRPPLEDQPYWLKEQMGEGSYTVNDQNKIGLPQNMDADVKLAAIVDTTYIGMNIPLQYKFTDPVRGEIYQPVITVPALLVKISPAVVLTNTIPKQKPQIAVDYEVQQAAASGDASIIFNSGSSMKVVKINIKPRVSVTQTMIFSIDSILKGKRDTSLTVSIALSNKKFNGNFSNYLRLINYDHIPTVHYLFQSKARIVNDEIKVEGKRIGYIKGAGDNVPDALLAMGYEVVYLDQQDITESKLKTLDAVITGVRAYNTNEYLSGKYDILMNYVENGGNLVVQYNTSSQIGPVRPKISPYPFDISRNRITDEKATVRILQPTHPILNYPNKITDKDFDGWVQERSIYHASNWDSHYETIFAMHDPGENDDEGSLITSKFGKGNFVYTGLVFFRELPAGVPGAYRLLANIIALNHKKGF